MGDRVLIQLRNKNELSPLLYLHWGGSSACELLARVEKTMKSRGTDVPYAFARLVGAACRNAPGNLSVGVWNADRLEIASDGPRPLVASDSHGDAGCIVVDIDGPAWTAHYFGGYLGGDTANGWELVASGAKKSRAARKRRAAAMAMRQHERDGAPSPSH